MIHQKYFAATEHEQAVRYDAKLARRQERTKTYGTETRRKAAIPQQYSAERYAAPRKTPVTGLQISFYVDQRTGVITSCYPEIKIAAKGVNGVRYHTSRMITPTTRTLPEAWKQSCKLLADIHGLKRVPSRWVKAQPEVEQFEKLLSFYREKGKALPTDTLDFMRETA